MSPGPFVFRCELLPQFLTCQFGTETPLGSAAIKWVDECKRWFRPGTGRLTPTLSPLAREGRKPSQKWGQRARAEILADDTTDREAIESSGGTRSWRPLRSPCEPLDL